MYTYKDWKYYKQTLQEIDSKDILTALELMNVGVKSKIQLETENLWKPTCKDIKINPKNVSETIPQAWEYNWNWYYNFEWALLESKTLWKRIPTKEEWEELINDSKEEILKLPLAGCRSNSDSDYYVHGTHGYYWSSSPICIYGYYVTITSTHVNPRWSSYRAYGFSVRCLKN